MHTVWPQTVIILVFLGDVLPWKYLHICWDFEMSQMESGLNFIMRKVIQAAVSLLEPRKLGPS